MGKKDVDASMEEEEEECTVVLSPIANPLAKDKLVKKILKLVKAGEAYCLLHDVLRCHPCCVLGGGGCRQSRPAGDLMILACSAFSACMHAMVVSSLFTAHSGLH